MSGSDRDNRLEALALRSFYAIAIIGAIALFYTFGALNGRESERREQAPAAYSQAAQSDAERACAGREGGALFECVYERVEASQEQARGEQDLSAQQRAATSALASAVIALLTLIVTIIGVWFVKRTLDATLDAVEDTSEATGAMLEANTLAQEAMQRQLRAYVGFTAMTLQVKNGQHLLSVTIKNAGQTPAYGLKIRVSQCLVDGADPVTAKFRFRNPASGGTGLHLGPGHELRTVVGPLNFEHPKTIEFLRAGKVLILFGGTLSYRDAFQRLRRTTFKNFVDWADFEGGQEGLSACTRGNHAN